VSRKLLLADDSITIQRVIELTFSGEDIEVVAVGDGEQAIARIPIERPDIVLADIGMPKRSGYDVAAFVQQHPDLSHIPVLLLAGAFEPVDEARAKDVKCAGVLVKPFEPQQVIARVRELTGGGAGEDTRASRRPMAAPPEPLPERIPGLETFEREVEEVPAVDRRAPPPDSRSAAPEPGVPAPGSREGSLDDYFDRLDAAFATLGNVPSPPDDQPGTGTTDDAAGATPAPTIEDVLAGASLLDPPASAPPAPGRVAPPPIEPPNVTPMLATGGPPEGGPDGREAQAPGNVIADVFRMLLAAEQGERDPVTIPAGSPPASPAVTDDLVDQLARRVLERLAPETAKDLVAEIVSEIAERLVREEIGRIRNRTP
jgi:CheY-like chemotaxis protein